MSNLSKRILTAAIAGTLFLGGILYNGWTALAICILLASACSYEYIAAVIKDKRTVWAIALGVLVTNVCLGVFYGTEVRTAVEQGWHLDFLMMVLFVFSGSAFLIAVPFAFFARVPIIRPIAGYIYCSTPFLLMGVFLAGIFADDLIAHSVFFIVWSTDSAAYFVGRYLGKHKLAPNISPNKTWEGAVGGVFGALLISYFLFPPLDIDFYPELIIPTSIATILGDLLQSHFKRQYGLKDSGNLLPGHGGVFDRFDGFLLAFPVWLLLYILHEIPLWPI